MKNFSKYKIQEWNKNISRSVYSRRSGTIAPSKSELDFYRKYLRRAKKEFKSPKLLVLGATPEIRDLGLQLGFNVVAVDINVGMIKLAAQFLKIKERGNEVIMKANWLEAPLAPDAFAVIIGDVSLNNVSFSDIFILLKKINLWIKPSGYLILRNIVIPDASKDITTLENDLSLWRNKKMGLREFYFRYRFGHCYPSCYNKKNRAFEADREFKRLDRLYRQNVFAPKEYRELNSRRSVFVHIVLPLSLFLKKLKKYFTVVEISAEVSEKFGFYPVKLFCGRSGK